MDTAGIGYMALSGIRFLKSEIDENVESLASKDPLLTLIKEILATIAGTIAAICWASELLKG